MAHRTASRANPAWLGDGRLVFVRIEDRRTARPVVAADVDAGERTDLLHEEDDREAVSAGAPTVSPDGTRLAVTLPLDGWEHLYLVAPDSGERRRLTSGEFEDKGPADLALYEDWAHETKFPAVESAQAELLGGNRWEAGGEWDAASPRTRFERYDAPLYNFHGTGDAYVNVEQLDVIVDGMLEHGNEYEAEYYPDESHVFSKRATWERTSRKTARAFDDHLRD